MQDGVDANTMLLQEEAPWRALLILCLSLMLIVVLNIIRSELMRKQLHESASANFVMSHTLVHPNYV